MKRIVACLVAVLMLAIVTPVVFAADMDFTGEISSEIEYKEENLSGNSEMELTANLGNNLKAGIRFDGMEQTFPWVPTNLSINNLWLETEGALFPGTPEFITRIGGMDVNYSDYIANEINTTGISMDQLNVGPVTLGGYYSWNQDSNLDRGAYLKVQPIEGVEAQGTLVKANEELSYAVETKVNPLEDVEVSGAFAAIDQGEQAYRVDGKYQLIEAVELRAGYQNIPEGFAPAHMNTDDLDQGQGFTVGATAEKYGFKVTGDYADYSKTIDYSVARTLNLAGMDFDTKLEGNFNTETTSVDELEASVEYEAPNGLNLTAGYDFISNQPNVSAGLNLEF